MFSYYGSKSKIVDYYPPPKKYDKIIEPFAGSARYSLKYFDRDILLVDKYEVIIKIWKWLQQCSVNDILSLPELSVNDRIQKNNFDCIEQYELMRFLLQQGTVGGNKVYPWGVKSFITQRKNIACNLYKIKHWDIRLGEYIDIDNQKATWFVDPPYQQGGHKYVCSNKKIDYSLLSEWCRSREGHVIVCENTNSSWLPFTPMVKMNGLKFKTMEAIWSNEPTNYNVHQCNIIY